MAFQLPAGLPVSGLTARPDPATTGPWWLNMELLNTPGPTTGEDQLLNLILALEPVLDTPLATETLPHVLRTTTQATGDTAATVPSGLTTLTKPHAFTTETR